MSYRKKRLIFIQTLLLLTAHIALYIFYYYEGVDSTQKEVKVESKEFEKLGEKLFEDVEYKGIDANGNRYKLKSKIASFDEKSPELVNMIGMHATFYFRNGNILSVSGKTGKYNNKTNDMKFREDVQISQADNKILQII